MVLETSSRSFQVSHQQTGEGLWSDSMTFQDGVWLLHLQPVQLELDLGGTSGGRCPAGLQVSIS